MSDQNECCPKFDPKPWNEIIHDWNDKLFLMDTIPQVFHIPLPGVMKKTIIHMWELAKKNNIATDLKDFLLLAYDPTPWKSELYLSVTNENPEVKNIVRLTGTFISKVFDGPYKDVPKYIKGMDDYLNKNNKSAKKLYFYFTTCPKCAKIYEHNYIVAFAEVM